MMNMLVDFSHIDNIINKQHFNTEGKMTIDEYNNKYDKRTTQYYRSHRLRKIDPIDSTQLNDTNGFKFKYIWNPYDGNIVVSGDGNYMTDPCGPLYFSPQNIVMMIYYNRLQNLWVDPSDEAIGYFSGHYGDNLGIGDTFEIPGRGRYPERYLFRLPVPDCYLDNNHNEIMITMGPKLTDEDVVEIDKLVELHWMDNDISTIYKKNGSLLRIKMLYEVAISKHPTKMSDKYFDLIGTTKNDVLKHEQADEYMNRLAVDLLR